MVSIRLEGGVGELIQACERLSRLDKRDLNEALGQALRDSTVERFGTGRDPKGGRWKPSARAREDGGLTLVRSARLKNSIQYRATEDGFAVGTNVIYAATHQLGAKSRVIRPKHARALRFRVGGRWITKKQVTVDIPARPFLGLSKEDREELRGTMQDFVSGEG